MDHRAAGRKKRRRRRRTPRKPNPLREEGVTNTDHENGRTASDHENGRTAGPVVAEEEEDASRCDVTEGSDPVLVGPFIPKFPHTFSEGTTVPSKLT